MTTPERHTIRGADLATLTGVELFQALAHAHLTRADLEPAIAALQDPHGDPGLGLAALRFLQAVALAMAVREGSTATWADAQAWDVTADLADAGEDPLAVERREYRVATSLVTGLPPDVAEALPVADVAEYARVRSRT